MKKWWYTRKKVKRGKLMKTKDMVLCAVFSALICIFSVMTIPIGVVPISMAVFGILLTSIILGWKKAAISVLVFILLGTVGIPVFAGFKSGVGVLLGPTGGYIWSFIFVAITVGALTSKLHTNKVAALAVILGASLIGVIVCYTFGTIQFMIVSKNDLIKSLSLCVYPFIVVDILKCVGATLIGYAVRKALIKNKLIYSETAVNN